MKLARSIVYLYTAAIMFLFAVVVTHRPQHIVHHYDGVQIVSNDEMGQLVEPWKEETARRFPNALIFAAHGGTAAGKWICQNPDDPTSLKNAFMVHDIALSLHQAYPDRVIVLIVCNPDHLKCGVPGVYYAQANVWVTPDKHANCKDLNHLMYPEAVGNIFEFVTDYP